MILDLNSKPKQDAHPLYMDESGQSLIKNPEYVFFTNSMFVFIISPGKRGLKPLKL